MSILKDLSHIPLASIFISSGAQAFLGPGPQQVSKVAAAGIPQPDIAMELNGAAMVIGGTLLALGLVPRLAATILIGCLIPTTFVGHAFWKEKDEVARRNQQIQFAKNLGLLGGLLKVLLEG
jgi:putative oxidoreductase